VANSPTDLGFTAPAPEEFLADEAFVEAGLARERPVHPRGFADLMKEEAPMNEYGADTKRDTGSAEDQSKQAALEAKHAAHQANKANDAAAIAKAELTKRQAITAHAAALQEAERDREQAHAEKERFAQQLEGASKSRRHCQTALNEANAQVLSETEQYEELKVALDQADADMKAAIALASVKQDEFTVAHKKELDLKAQLADLETANEKFELQKAAAYVALAAAKAEYAQEVAKIKKGAADRDMSSFGA
jgi:chromosome segregation ATPase